MTTTTEPYDRTKHVGSGDIAGIIRKSPWATQVDIFRRKVDGEEEPTADKRALFKRGNRWEGVVGEMLVESLEKDGHDVEVVASNKRYTDEANPVFVSEIDYELLVDGELTNCELKTVHPFAAKDWGRTEDETPTHYTAQVQWGLGVTRRPKAILAALFGADYIRPYHIEADQAVINWMRNEAQDFWENHVVPKIAPPPEKLHDLSYLHPSVDGDAIPATLELTEQWLRLVAVRNEIKARESEAEAIEFALKRAMGDSPAIYSDDRDQELVTWTERRWSRLDQTALKEREPKIHKKFRKTGSSRTFLVKNPKK